MSQSILIPLGTATASATVTVAASADGRAQLLLFGEQRSWNAGIQIFRVLAGPAEEGVIEFLKGPDGSAISLPGPGTYRVVRLETRIPLGVVYETGTDQAAGSIPAGAPALTTASAIYTRDTATGDFTSPCSTGGAIHVRAQALAPSGAAIVSVAVDETFAAFPAQAGTYVQVANSSCYTLEYRRGASGAAARLPPGEQREIALPTGDVSELQWRALGAAHPVIVTGDVVTLGSNSTC